MKYMVKPNSHVTYVKHMWSHSCAVVQFSRKKSLASLLRKAMAVTSTGSTVICGPLLAAAVPFEVRQLGVGMWMDVGLWGQITQDHRISPSTAAFCASVGGNVAPSRIPSRIPLVPNGMQCHTGRRLGPSGRPKVSTEYRNRLLKRPEIMVSISFTKFQCGSALPRCFRLRSEAAGYALL